MEKKLIFDIETTGLNSIEDRITCISCGTQNSNIISFYGENESRILQQFWESLNTTDILIGFNSDSFDIPFLIKRSLINKVKISKFAKSVDLRKVVNAFFYSYDKYVKGSLNDWAEILGFGAKTTKGLEVVEAYEKKDWKLIKQHCELDVKITLALLKRVEECNLV